ncbi:transposase [Bradyrhizobium sp. 145]|uniref:transposase n=1 Tax=Bradyrhizobium sp. 145 TaxID=2782621 RepID=UPI001FFBE6DA|nr:transposase [Bradyrhizobium sp. 145]MCK1689367.1 transposase [Bradyrhizobium sp. 145]
MADLAPSRFDITCLRGSRQLFELGEDLPDRIAVGAVGRQADAYIRDVSKGGSHYRGCPRLRFTTEQKLSVANETLQPDILISYIAHPHGLSPSLVFRWRRLMRKGGKVAIRADEDVVAASEVRWLEERFETSNACSAARPWRS